MMQYAPTIDVAAAVNSQRTLAACLMASPNIRDGSLKVRSYEGYQSAALAYNQALADSDADVLVLAHQDVYLPEGFLKHLREQIAQVAGMDPNWGILGVIGLNEQWEVQGETWSSGIGQIIGRRIDGPQPVVTLDEVMLIIRRASGLRFDEKLPGFHLYAADIVQAARKAGLRSYAVPLQIIHHSRTLLGLDATYRRAWRYVQNKWRADLPIPNLVCTLEASEIPLWVKNLKVRWRNRGRKRIDNVSDPAEIARRIGYR